MTLTCGLYQFSLAGQTNWPITNGRIMVSISLTFILISITKPFRIAATIVYIGWSLAPGNNSSGLPYLHTTIDIMDKGARGNTVGAQRQHMCQSGYGMYYSTWRSFCCPSRCCAGCKSRSKPSLRWEPHSALDCSRWPRLS